MIANFRTDVENLFSEALETFSNNPWAGVILAIALVLMLFSMAKKVGPIELTAIGQNRSFYLSIIAFALVAVLIYDEVRLKNPFLQSNKIEQIYIYGTTQEEIRDVRDAKKLYKRVINLANRDNIHEAEKINFVRYLEAKAAYRLGLIEYNDQNYGKAFEWLDIAYTRYKEYRSYFNSLPEEELLSTVDEDGRFNSSKAYDALHKMAVAYYYKALDERNDVEAQKYILASIDLYREVLQNEDTSDEAFRGNVFYNLALAYSKNGEKEKSVNAHVKAFIVNPSNQTNNQALEELNLLNGDSLDLPDDEIKNIFTFDEEIPVFWAGDSRNLGFGNFSDPVATLPDELPRAEVAGQENLNPFTITSFPRSTCGDGKEQDLAAYPLDYYPIYIEYSENNLRRVRDSFCGDAYRSQSADKIQVATFHNRSNAHTNSV